MPFSRIIGQRKAVALLGRALAGGRLAHGYLFVGPEGVGKRAAAHALAASMLCRTNEGGRPCGQCSGCRKFSAGSHPDFLPIRPDGASIKISQIRELKKALGFPPFEYGMRVVVIEEAQTMGREAGNSLLKILEEPPADNLLLLVASDSEPILETIVSRCQVVPFVPLAVEQAAKVVRQTHPQLSAEEALTMAKLTGGCPGRMESLYSSDVLRLYKECQQILLEVPLDEQAEVVLQAIDLSGRLSELKEELSLFFDLLTFFFKDAMIDILCDRENDAGCSSSAARERWNLQRLFAMVEAVDAARSDLSRNCSRVLVCEVLLLELFCGGVPPQAS